MSAINGKFVELRRIAEKAVDYVNKFYIGNPEFPDFPAYSVSNVVHCADEHDDSWWEVYIKNLHEDIQPFVEDTMTGWHEKVILRRS